MARPDNRVTTRNVNYPRGGGKRIERGMYEAVRKAILAVVPRSREGVPFKDLPRLVAARAPRSLFQGRSVSWYTTTVKLDLEARGLIERVPRATPQRLRRVR